MTDLQHVLRARETLAEALRESIEGTTRPPPSPPTVPGVEEQLRRRPSKRDLVPTWTDVFCTGNDRASRHCRFRNLCYNAQTQAFLVLKPPRSVLLNFPDAPETVLKDLLDYTTIQDMNTYYFDAVQVDGTFFERMGEDRLTVRVYDDGLVPSAESAALGAGQVRLTVVQEPTLLVKRFYPINIMHVLHDDWLGYFDLREHWGHDRAPASRLVAIDQYGPSRHDEAYDWLGPPLQRIEQLMGWPPPGAAPAPRREEYVCFRDVVLGSIKANTWYQYGYFEPQGPLKSIPATGWRLRDIMRTVLRHLGVPPWDAPEQARLLRDLLAHRRRRPATPLPSTHVGTIAVFSRQRNRLILNEDELALRLEAEFGLPVRFVRMETMRLGEMVAVLRTTALAFGMHGALLAMAIFMPPGAVLVEGYPYAVPAENYTPYRTLAGLPGMFLAYRAWACTNPDDAVAYPNRTPGQGGIAHLPRAEQVAIQASNTVPPHLCCSNPNWLYRIFQDTRVDTDQVVGLMWEAIEEAYAGLPETWKPRGND